MDDDERWTAVLARDEGADETFVFGVRTTGVYCRPSCPARRPLRQNVAFFDTPAEARAAALRACCRCDPDGAGPRARRADLVARTCAILDRPDPPTTLADLAAQVGVSAFHLHRVFRGETGITPKAYATARRAERTRDNLDAGSSVTAAVYDAGYGSTGRFYDEYPWRLGMAPSDYRRGGPDTTVRFAVGRSTLGSVLVAATDRGVCGISLGDDPNELVRELHDRFDAAELVGDDPDFARVVATVIALVEEPVSGSTLPLDVRATAFQERVWRALREVGPGTTVTYAEIARRIGAPTAVRAVGAACAANPVAVVVPCHRVVRTDGALAGYRWGVPRKAELLDREAAGAPTT